MMIYSLINVFILNEVRSYFQILDHLIITLEIGVNMLQKKVLVVYISYLHVYYSIFILLFFNFWDFGPVFDLFRVLNEKIRVIQETFLSLESDV